MYYPPESRSRSGHTGPFIAFLCNARAIAALPKTLFRVATSSAMLSFSRRLRGATSAGVLLVRLEFISFYCCKQCKLEHTVTLPELLLSLGLVCLDEAATSIGSGACGTGRLGRLRAGPEGPAVVLPAQRGPRWPLISCGLQKRERCTESHWRPSPCLAWPAVLVATGGSS